MPYTVSISPHIKSEEDISYIMKMVCIALIPAFFWGAAQYGWYAIAVTLTCVVSCVITEALCQKLRAVPITISDWSAVVTGLLLAAVLPPNVKLWVAAIGGVFAIGVAKHAFGGLGSNIWNPALLSRAFLQNAYPDQIGAGSWPFLGLRNGVLHNLGISLNQSFTALEEAAREKGADVISSATALAQMKGNGDFEASWEKIWEGFIGLEGGCIAEVSALFLLVGGIILLAKKIITWEIPFFYIATVGILAWVLPAPYIDTGGETVYREWLTGPWLIHLFGGGLFIGAFFMATDMVTTPISKHGRIVFGIGCGVLTIVIRLYAGYPEGVCYSILLMNTCVPLIDTWTRPVKFGAIRQ